MLKRLFLFFSAVFGGFLACYVSLYVLVVYFTIERLPFCQEAAYAWMMSIETSVCIEEEIVTGVPREGYVGPVSAISGLPVPYPVKYFFGHDPNYFGGKWHGGVDIPCPVGTPIRATMGGIVSFAGWSSAGYGSLVVIENRGVQTFFAHASEIDVVPGQVVRAGDIVALSGNTGNSTGPHVHYEVRVGGTQVDPLEVELPGSRGDE